VGIVQEIFRDGDGFLVGSGGGGNEQGDRQGQEAEAGVEDARHGW
jgi:hypothetical protein